METGVIPIVNENDTLAVSEIKFGDNDTLSAITAAMIHADMLFLMTDVDYLYDKNPRVHTDARPIEIVGDISELEADGWSRDARRRPPRHHADGACSVERGLSPGHGRNEHQDRRREAWHLGRGDDHRHPVLQSRQHSGHCPLPGLRRRACRAGGGEDAVAQSRSRRRAWPMCRLPRCTLAFSRPTTRFKTATFGSSTRPTPTE